jgi:group II intron reverse transcriptase/maturase
MSFKTWKEIDWSLIERSISRLQQRIYKASIEGNRQKLRTLQRRLILSKEARLLSVRRVTELNRGKNTPGVDGMTVVTNDAKILMAKKLRIDGKASPIRRVLIPKPGKTEKRPLGIPVINDRAKQMLLKLALEPEWEAKFEMNSYGFRPGRSTHDAIKAIFQKLRGSKGYILDADISKCFDRIDQSKLLKKLDLPPFMEIQVKAWLESDIMHGYANRPKVVVETNTQGTPQGGIISPLLANIALHGLENATKEFYVDNVYDNVKTKGRRDRLSSLTLVRYADDFVVIANKESEIIALKPFIQKWLDQECGLELSEEKTSIKNTTEGFEFLGFHLISLKKDENYTFRIHISKASKKRFLTKTRDILQNNRSASAGHLIAMLNPVITGWCNYYKFCDCSKDFKQVEFALFGQLRAWVFRRKSKGLKSKKDIKEKYFPSETQVTFNGNKHKGNWIMMGTLVARQGQQKKVNLVYPSWIQSSSFVKVKGAKSPFDGDHIYWSTRTQRYGSFSKTERKLLTAQNGRCNLCNEFFKTGNTIEVDHIQRLADGGKDVFSNLQLLHRHCHEVKSRKEQSKSSTMLNTREPDEAKVSRPDLKSSVGPKGPT